MRIAILGTTEVTRDGAPVEIGGARLRALLVLLALDAGRPVPAERIIDALWADRVPAAAPNALQSLVSRLRAAIGREHLETRPGGYRLDVPREAVDAHDFEERLLRARRAADPQRRAGLLGEALALWRGPALADVAWQEFAEAPAARLEGLRRAARLERVDAELELGRHAGLVPELEALAAAEPLSEPVRARLMRALYGAGRQADALAEYGAIKAALAEELGVDPSPELAAVHLAVLRQDAALAPAAPSAAPPAAPPVPAAPDAPPDALPDAPPGNLPTRLTSFIGRDDDLKHVAEALAGGRLVTLTGPGGAGKTRLSLEAAARLAGHAPDGAWFVQLAPVDDPAEVATTVLDALGLRETVLVPGGPGRLAVAESADPPTRLAAALRGRRLLLLLDNCEHVLDAAAALADRVLAECPAVRVLATSREPLGITGETLRPVEPLPLPPADAAAGDALGYPAVRLFADRAAAVAPGFAVTGANVADVVRICRALDGMPLAIELAAARLRAMTPRQVAARLGDRFRLLNAGSRTALPRHQTLRAVVEWSWDLLDGAERALWRRLAVFQAGATVESAEDVCAGGDLDRDDVLDVLAALVDKSLVVADTAAEPPRYRMLETIRAYGLERLAQAGEEDAVRDRHAAAMLALAETAEPHLFRAGQIRWLDHLGSRHDDLQAALRRMVATGDAASAARFCAALGWYQFLSGRLEEAVDGIDQLARMPGLPEDQPTAVALAIGAMATLDSQNDNASAFDWLARALGIIERQDGRALHPILRLARISAALFEKGWDRTVISRLDELLVDGDPWVRGVGYFARGQFAANFALNDRLEDDFARALANFEDAGDRWGTAFTLTSQAELRGREGRYAEAARLYERALATSRALGLDLFSATNMRLSTVLRLAGAEEEAAALLADALPNAERNGSRDGIAVVHYQLGEFARHTGEYGEAAAHLERAAELAAGLNGPPQFDSQVRGAQGQLALATGDADAGRALLAESLRLAVQAHDHPVIAHAVAAHAAAALHDGDAARAAELLGEADAVRGGRDLSLPDVLELEGAAREALGDGFDAAYARGRSRTFQQVLDAFGLSVETRPILGPDAQWSGPARPDPPS
ncbi:BTAD domain-containing putative transcriptional regulator [Actinomadura parmotrematis]|uniref:Winged helix-turn-helix domain-containing protein n=1 Tax=Actinomadura parmotrematis TaxID=2864039 RepID=A0ABS7FXQ0_9ACTN|nr:BTAD domain-containing putative transcriptional regulator [Actinomadura parmotrematis]MBW8484755.1 winged helix-turn-helix domain-containing protein [Actinomadura parmotrematis]